MTSHSLRDTADKPSADAGLTMAGHRDETARDFLGEVNDFPRRAIDSAVNDLG